MLKEVGASGQISLGKKYAGQLFDVVFAPDGRIEMVPMKAVPTVHEPVTDVALNFEYSERPATTQHTVQEAGATYRVGDGWLTPARLAARKAAYERSPEEMDAAHSKWQEENKDAIEAFNERARKIGSMGHRIHAWRKANAERDAAIQGTSTIKA